jgi:hypothetical protein
MWSTNSALRVSPTIGLPTIVSRSHGGVFKRRRRYNINAKKTRLFHHGRGVFAPRVASSTARTTAPMMRTLFQTVKGSHRHGLSNRAAAFDTDPSLSPDRAGSPGFRIDSLQGVMALPCGVRSALSAA